MNGRSLLVVFAVVIAFVVGGLLGFVAANAPPLVGQTFNPEDLVVFSVEPAIEGASQPGGAGKYSVAVLYRAETGTVDGRLLTDPFGGVHRDLGTLGAAKDRADAVVKFGTVRWQHEGVYVGDGTPTDVFIPRDEMHAHR